MDAHTSAPVIPVSSADTPAPAGKKCSGCQTDNDLGFEFDYAFQPIVHVRSRTIFAHEALVRGPNGEPAYTILDRVTDANRYQFDQACRVKAIENAARLGMQSLLSINFLPNAVYKPEACIRTTLAAAERFGFPTDRIVFEVAESERVVEMDHLLDIFRKYDSLGFHTAIDDFGAGFSGLDLLCHFQPRILKIDMRFVRDIDSNPAKQAVVDGIVHMGSKLGTRIIAEGVETVAERDCLAALGIRLMQGYLFARPAFRALGEIDPAAWRDAD